MALSKKTYSVTNDETLAFDGTIVWPRWSRPWLNELGRFSGELCIFLHPFQSNLSRIVSARA